MNAQRALALVAARLRQVSGSKWGSRRYFDMDHLDAPKRAEEAMAS